MGRPLVYIFISMIIGCLFGILFADFFKLDVVIATSFFIFMFFISNKKIFFFQVCFFLIGCFCVMMYFNLNLKVECQLPVRVVNENKYYTVLSYKGRRIDVKGKISGAELGDKLYIAGYYYKAANYEYGVVGTFKVSRIISKKEDFISQIYEYREKLREKFNGVIGKDFSSKTMAIAFGDSSELSQEDKDNLMSLGVSYAICVSGLHMLIVFKTFQRFSCLEVAVVLSIFYTIFTGCNPATVRALLMLVILKYSKKLGKNYDMYSALSFAGMLLLLFKPYYILNVGFMMSFLATFSIAIFYKKVSRALYKLPEKLNESISVSISVQILTMPYVLLTMGNFSLGFVVGTIFMIPLFSIIIALANIALVFSKINIVFEVICIPIKFVLIALSGVNNVLLKFTPPLLYVPLTSSIFVLYLYICFIVARCGYKKVMWSAAVFLLTIVISTYSFFPEISYVVLKSGDGFIVRYKFENILISSYNIIDTDEKQKLQGIFNINKFITNKNNDFSLYVGKKYNIYIPKFENDKKVQISVKGDTNIVSYYSGALEYSGINDKKKYDIIENGSDLKKSELPMKQVDLYIINNEAIEVRK